MQCEVQKHLAQHLDVAQIAGREALNSDLDAKLLFFRSYLCPSCKGQSHFSLEFLEQMPYFTNPSTSLNAGCSAVLNHSNATISVVTNSAPFPASRSNAASRLRSLRELQASVTTQTSNSSSSKSSAVCIRHT